jgi:hypothetical protein
MRRRSGAVLELFLHFGVTDEIRRQKVHNEPLVGKGDAAIEEAAVNQTVIHPFVVFSDAGLTSLVLKP